MSATIRCFVCGTLRLFLLVCLFQATRQECDEGFFGTRCAMMCHCRGGNTQCADGNCTQGCHKGFIGPLCQYSRDMALISEFFQNDEVSDYQCAVLQVATWYVNFKAPSEVNMLSFFNPPVGLRDFEVALMKSDDQFEPILSRNDTSYLASYTVALKQRAVGYSGLRLENRGPTMHDHAFRYIYLCELEILGEFHCCSNETKTTETCQVVTDFPFPVCEKREFKACPVGFDGDFCEEGKDAVMCSHWFVVCMDVL
ncbi:hypothetical protein ElyMa_006541500 [Elysia marginata]|uniref:EGF-like domain-containing protein n=1 Tax=Elysia marginata TaxID=1093978 RepID=A0AAV4I7P1_9GAST|nr:hypothetical protein ElyMa_006541500 [Elysia marginata]